MKTTKFNLNNLLGELGEGLLKDASLFSPSAQAQKELFSFIETHCQDSLGALTVSLKDSIPVLEINVEQPLHALISTLENILQNDETLIDFVRLVDQRYGQIYDERPIFQKKGEPPRTDDPYTHQNIADTLKRLLREAQKT